MLWWTKTKKHADWWLRNNALEQSFRWLHSSCHMVVHRIVVAFFCTSCWNRFVPVYKGLHRVIHCVYFRAHAQFRRAERKNANCFIASLHCCGRSLFLNWIFVWMPLLLLSCPRANAREKRGRKIRRMAKQLKPKSFYGFHSIFQRFVYTVSLCVCGVH